VATAWNEGRIEVPLQAPWLSDFLEEVMSFTGISDAHDDQVDFLSHAWAMADVPPPTPYVSPPAPIRPPRSRSITG
jgi:hypothetical protein